MEILVAAGAPRKKIGSRPGPTSEDIRAAQSMSSGDRATMINSMVERLATRLKKNGNDIEGWMRLINANVVLGKSDAARTALTDARKQFADDKILLAKLDELARRLGLKT